MLRGVVPKVVRDMAKIWYFVGFRTNLQLIVLKILTVVSCGESRFVGLIQLEGCFLLLGQGICTVMDVLCCGNTAENGSEDD